MTPHIQYTKTDDEVRIAYYRMGAGVPLLIASEIVWSHLGSTHGMREYHRSRSGRGLGRGMELVRYDARGTGLSDRVPDVLKRECLLLDMEAVRTAVGFDRFVLFGHVNGCISAIEYAAAFPDRVQALVLVSPWLDGSRHLALSEHFGIQPVLGMTELQWRGFTEIVALKAMGVESPESRRLAQVYRDSMTPEAYATFIECRRRVNLTEAASRIQAPTLIVRRESEVLPPLDLEVARCIPNADLVHIPPREGPFQAWLDEETNVIEEFLAIPVVTAVPDGPPIAIRAEPATSGLSPRETEVLQLIAAGYSTQEMARMLTLSEHTIARHIANIYDKIGARGRAAAAAYALRYGIA